MADAPSLLVELTNPPNLLQFTGGVNPKGEYDSGTSYALGDGVSYNGSSYVARQATTGNLPTDTTYWQVLASKGDTGETGETGATGATGPTGANAYVYIAYASDASGTGFTMTFNPALNYIAVRNTTVEIPSPQASDFAGLWKNYKGEGGIPVADAGGTVDAITADYSPDVSLADKTMVAFVALGANTSTTPTFAPDGLTPHTIVKYGGQPLAAGDVHGAGMVCIVEYNAANTRWELLNPAPSTSVYPPDYISGFTLALDSDAEHDVTFGAGAARTSGGLDIRTTSAITKQIDAAWASGNNAGGMLGGDTISAEALLNLWAIGGAGVSADFGFSLSPTSSPTLPDGYTGKVWLGYVKLDSSSNIIPCDWIGDGKHLEMWFKARQTVASGLNSTSYTTQSLSGWLISGVQADALFGGYAATDDYSAVWLSDDGLMPKLFSIHFAIQRLSV
jgi:hypothetical protein